MKKISFAIVGCGHIGKRHAEMVQRNERASLAAIVDVRPESELGITLQGVPYFNKLEEFLASAIAPEVDVVTIATPNGLHAQQSLLCLGAHKHVVIEKPMALTKKDAERVIHKALDVHRHVFAVMQNRYSPPSRWIKGVLSEGRLGKIFMVQLNCYWNRDERYYVPGSWHGTKSLDGGTLFTQFSHFIDMLYWLFGDIGEVRARLINNNHSQTTEFEDSGFVTFDLVEGGHGCINFSTSVWDRNLESSLTVIAEYGSVKIGGQYMDQVEYCNIKDYTMPALASTNPGNDYGGYKGSAQNHNYVIDNVIKVFHGEGTIDTNALEGLKVVEIIERIYGAARTG